MFKNGDDILLIYPTPERVFTIVQMLRKKSMTRGQLHEEVIISPERHHDPSILNQTLNVALELGLIDDRNGAISLTPDATKIATIDDFRRSTSNMVLQRTDGKFFKIATAYLQDADEYMGISDWSTIVAKISRNHGISLVHDEMLAFRFWAPFFGLGYLHLNTIIPNCYRRIMDLCHTDGLLGSKKDFSIADFMGWLENRSSEMKAGREGLRIGLAVSQGLLVMEDLKHVSLEERPDSPVKWLMHDGARSVSHVRFREVNS
jgi:hypothetical protein